MLDKVDLTRTVSKEEYKARLSALERELFDLERRAKAAGVPTIVVLEGWETAGKGSTLRVLTERLDPRAMRIHAIEEPRSHERERPWMWRFWMRLPNRGEIAIFDTGWYHHVLQERLAGTVGRREFEDACREIQEFEHQLADDGHVIVKLFLHIAKDEQRRRLKRAAKDPEDFFEPTKAMWRQNKRYEEARELIEEMLAATETEWAPWTIVPAHDRRFARLTVFETLIRLLGDRLARTPGAPPPLILPGGKLANGARARAATNGGATARRGRRGRGAAKPAKRAKAAAAGGDGASKRKARR